MHRRTAIRNALQTRLSNLVDVTVLRTPFYTLDQLPTVTIETPSDTVEIDNASMGQPPSYLHELTTVITATVEATDNADTVLDALALEIEILLGGDLKLSGLVLCGELEGTENEYIGEGEKPLAQARITYQYYYKTPADNPV